MPTFKIVLILLGLLIAASIASLVMPIFTRDPAQQATSPFIWLIVAGFVLAPLSLWFLLTPTHIGLLLLSTSTVLVLIGGLLTPNHLHGSSTLLKAINLASAHLLMLTVALLYSFLYNRKKT